MPSPIEFLMSLKIETWMEKVEFLLSFGVPDWGASAGQETHVSKTHFGGSGGDLAASRVISKPHLGSLLEPSWVPFGAKILEKGALECPLALSKSQNGSKVLPNRSKSVKLTQNGIQIV